MSDNFHVKVCSSGKGHFETAVKLAWANCPGGKASYYICQLPEGNCPECCQGYKGYWAGTVADKTREYIKYPCTVCRGTGKSKAISAMILLWNEAPVRGVNATKLPFPLTCEAAVDFLWNWLQSDAEYCVAPDHDGSNSKGFMVTTGNFWGHVEGSHYAFIGIYPEWQMYGK